MAEGLIDSGHQTAVFNRARAQAEAPAKKGARVADRRAAGIITRGPVRYVPARSLLLPGFHVNLLPGV